MTNDYLLEFVRGERLWNEAEAPGVRVDFENWSLSDAEGSGVEPVRVSIHDVVGGFKVHLEHPIELRRWAFIVLNASNSIELEDAFDSTEKGELLVEALWDASFGHSIRPKTRVLILNS